ncbi:hypothetical protein [Methylobacterium nodulans]|uniref:hypothetical protein n=1 Tax=Methylobacterium nodulans TaxID=114616 RepID=UPI00031F306A|nr:hypothetical protein [Methylobacterium nodulans]
MSNLIGPELHGGTVDPKPHPVSPGWIAGLCVTIALGLLLVVVGNGAGLRGSPIAFPVYWTGTVLVLVPAALRVSRPLVARGERLVILLVMAEALYLVKVVYYPLNFVGHDEFLHWTAAVDLITARRLFLTNPLLEVQASYPGLEIVTTAVAHLTGTSVFVAGSILLAVLRATFVGALFLFLEKISGSVRIAGIGCLVYMGCPTFLLFESMFSYESLGIVLCALTFAIEAGSRDLEPRQRYGSVLLIGLVLASLAVTHHLSSAFGAIYFGGLALTEALRHGPMRTGVRLVLVTSAVLAITLPLLWMELRGNPVESYLGPVIEHAYKVLLNKIQGFPVMPAEIPNERPQQPILMRATTLFGVLLIALCLATGFFRTWGLSAVGALRPGWALIGEVLRKRHWRDSRLIFLTMVAVGFPVSVALRLTIGGWEVGNRMGSFVFFAVALLVAVSIVHFWQRRAARGWRLHASSAFVAIIVMSGSTSATIDPIRGMFRVVADSESIETMGVETALWTKEWLGPGNRFSSDRINRLLLAGYGRQDVRIDVWQGITAGRVFLAEQLYPDGYYALVNGDVDFLLADLRLTFAEPVMGYYYEPWEDNTGMKVPASSLLKFNDVEGVTRIYDNGFQIIYDVRALHAPR